MIKFIPARLLVLFLCFLLLCNLVLGLDAETSPVRKDGLATRQELEDGRCDENTPCSNGDCCNGSSGYCGRRPEYCEASVCTSNCDAKPECGLNAETFDCPLNVCCSYWGNCGTTEGFCDDRCQGNCEQPGSGGHSEGDVRNLVIGYYESWTLVDGGCRVKPINKIRYDSLTHLNVAFGYIKPKTFEIHPMEPATDQIFQELTNIKRVAPGLKVWLSLGGWTFSDNGTDTQPVFGDLSSTPEKRQTFIKNLVTFMREWGFDGVDIDWEYPGAPDRGGNEEADTENYVELLADMRSYFDSQPERWGISFAAPTSYWYLRWFDIRRMVQYVNWINLMSYDLHGSWDNEESYVGPYVNSHTNLTEIKDALGLLWRNDVPANQVNLGIGFYGRSFTLKNFKCWTPGCQQKGPGEKGPCTDTEGVLSYSEIMSMISTYSLNWKHDEEAAVNYLAWHQDQWIAFDDPVTLQEKVAFANDQHLLGLMIWAIDLDDDDSTALDALLQPDGLGKFKTQNGVNSNLGNWTRQGAQCILGACSKDPVCDTGYVKHGHDLDCPIDGQRRNICCDVRNNPDPAKCSWNDGDFIFDIFNLGPGGICLTPRCSTGEILMLENDRFWVDNDDGDGDALCLVGKASYCCPGTETGADLCGPVKDKCVKFDDGKPVDEGAACPTGKKYMTYAAGDCNTDDDEWMVFCCDDEISSDACYWPERQKVSVINAGLECADVDKCKQGEIRFGDPSIFDLPEGENCEWVSPTDPNANIQDIGKSWCCDANKLSVKTDNLPVNLEYLFPKLGPESDEESFLLSVNTDGSGSTNVDDNSFGFAIMSGPEKDLTSLDKRDGSHWELFDCDEEKHERRQTIKAVCTETGADNNCGNIFLGRVEETVVEMPSHCGAGRYAVAVSLEPSTNHTLPHHLEKRLWKRGIKQPRVYDFTFDYDFSPIQRRGEADVLFRIDYSTEPGYWDEIVNRPGEAKRDIRDVHAEVKRDHGGSWPRYLHHSFKKEKRGTPPHEMDELHRRWFTKDKRWFSKDIGKWLDNMRKVDVEFEVAQHRIYKNYRWWLYDGSIACVNYRASLQSWVDLDIDVEITAVLSLIGNLADLNTWDQSHVLFKTKGDIVTQLNMESFAQLTFTTGPIELFGAQNFGVVFRVPGIVTIGPNFRIIGQLSGVATIHAEAHAKFDVVKWDYTQRYPDVDKKNDVKAAAIVDAKGSAPTVGKEWEWGYDVAAEGAITASIIPRIEFGIVFDYESVPDVTVLMALDNRVVLYGDAGIGDSTDPYVCYGLNGRSNLYAQVLAPTIFGYDLNNRWDIYNMPFEIIPRTCPVGGS